MRVQLGPKDWVEVKPVEELTRADRRAVNAVIVFDQAVPEKGPDGKVQPPKTQVIHASLDDDMFAAVAARVILDWSFTTLPIPSVNPDGLDRLTLEQDTELHKALQPHLDAILGKTAPVEGNEVPTPASAS